MASLLTLTLKNRGTLKNKVNDLIQSEENQIVKTLQNEEGMKNLLSSSNPKDIKFGLKTLLYAIKEGTNINEFFSNALNLIIHEDEEIRNLVYIIFLQEYTTTHTDSFLIVNKFQKDVNSFHVYQKSKGLKMLSYLPIPEIRDMVLTSISFSSHSSNPFFRFIALLSLVKVGISGEKSKSQETEGEDKAYVEDEIHTIYENFLKDSHWLVYGPAVAFVLDVFPQGLELLHAVYLKVVENLEKIEEIFIPRVSTVLTNYALTYLTGERSGEDDQSQYHLSSLLEKAREMIEIMHDPNILLSLSSLLYNLEFDYSKLTILEKPLKRIIAEEDNLIKQLGLIQIQKIMKLNPSVFINSIKIFHLRQDESKEIKLLKLNILSEFPLESNYQFIKGELLFWAHCDNTNLVCRCIELIGNIAILNTKIDTDFLRSMIELLTSPNEQIVVETVNPLRKFIFEVSSAKIENNSALVLYCLKIIDKVKSSKGRSSIIWLLGEYCKHFLTISIDALRKFTLGFIQESNETKLQILNFASKLYYQIYSHLKASNEMDESSSNHMNLIHQQKEKFGMLVNHLLMLALFDKSYLIREKARILKKIIPPLQNQESIDSNQLLIQNQLLKAVISNQNLDATKKTFSGISKKDEKKNIHIHTLFNLVSLLPQSQHPKKIECNFIREENDTSELRKESRLPHSNIPEEIKFRPKIFEEKKETEDEALTNQLEAFFQDPSQNSENVEFFEEEKSEPEVQEDDEFEFEYIYE